MTITVAKSVATTPTAIIATAIAIVAAATVTFRS